MRLQDKREIEIPSLTVDLELPLARDLAPAGAVVALAAEVAVELLAHVLEQQLRGVYVAQPLRLAVVVAQGKLRRRKLRWAVQSFAISRVNE